ncbi:hypothetical protein [Rahnella contaminans]|uniref:hypothetical protein n=1 Tax=Rahnella contaminans TaxID=2703882 RepID=UPI0023DA9950|nr:hypothetical protein [Rahnella contaminans]
MLPSPEEMYDLNDFLYPVQVLSKSSSSDSIAVVKSSSSICSLMEFILEDAPSYSDCSAAAFGCRKYSSAVKYSAAIESEVRAYPATESGFLYEKNTKTLY